MGTQRRYLVSFLIEKTLTVRAGVAVEAELSAATHLSAAERRAARAIKIRYANGEVVSDFSPIDKQWWANNALVKRPRKKTL